MIEMLQGRLIQKSGEHAVVDCGGVGYGVLMSATSLATLGPADGQDVTIFVRTQLTQDALRLFGFADGAERQLFDCLRATTGVGPKLALAILSTFSPFELSEVVANDNRAALNRVPGVGKKTAERLMLELKDRVATAALPLLGTPTPSAFMADVVSALANLGFTPAAAEKAADEARTSLSGVQDVAALVKHALRQTLPRTR